MRQRIRRIFELYYFWGEYVGDMLIPATGPGPVWRLFFRTPLLLYRCGLHHFVSAQVLLLTTIGRKTATPRTTPVGYAFDAVTNTYYVVAGWKSKTNWYRNALARPAVRVRVGSSSFEAVATRVDDNTVATLLAAYAQRNPFATRLYRNLTGIVSNGAHETFLKMAPFYPTLALRPTEAHSEYCNLCKSI